MLYPIPAVIAVVVHNNRILLVRRANPPDAGYWGFPGGKINTGESIESAAVRELFEETGIQSEALRVITAVDAFDRDDNHTLQEHFVLVAVLCSWVSGHAVAADDALEVGWFALEDINETSLCLSKDVVKVARMGVTLASDAAFKVL
ncbi:NUDIX hydrolase [Methylobacillus gramineus]|uniref:NUDIX hydrolase n=1 Tax=Methylobacillus gramineus TaxID=755169 RepID=UPI001CFFE430|nr:NUDIX hydrolase [Methylobacillus gramineus]MCB5185841.1 NUDIX hydrolase [Methylobacillus gramineus]